MKFFVIARVVGDNEGREGPWGPGWAPCAVHYDYTAANADCKRRTCLHRGHWEFSVVVVEFDP